MRTESSLSPDYFERMFRSDRDPWKFETSPYETVKYDATIAALGDRVYTNAFEVGCANGVLTQRLATHGRDLLAIDVSETALDQARRRCAARRHITFEQMCFPAQQPVESFDLIVLSEVVYYWSREDIRAAGIFVAEHLKPGGDLLLVHWIGETDYPHSGDDAVQMLHDHLLSLKVLRTDRTDKYRLDLWRKP